MENKILKYKFYCNDNYCHKTYEDNCKSHIATLNYYPNTKSYTFNNGISSQFYFSEIDMYNLIKLYNQIHN